MSATVYRIAVVEDDRDLQLIYKLKFETMGFHVAVAGDGEAGLILAEQFRPELILLDLRMPKMGGEEMLARLRREEWGQGMRVIILTNISKSEAPPALRFLSVDGYVVKAHYTPAQVVDMVRDILGTSASSR
jgi:DNA-binding response OmpR family regulator